MQSKVVSIDKKQFTITTLHGGYHSMGIRLWKKDYDKNHFIIKTVNTRFDYNRFKCAHTPIVIDTITNKDRFSFNSNIRVLDCPIKFAGSMEYRVPRELVQFEEVISKIISFEHTINHSVLDYYAYLTVDQNPIDAFEFQRNPGCHVDGFQGANIVDKKRISRSYIAYDCLPTIFYPHQFRTDYLNPKTDNFFLSFDDQADENLEAFYDPYSILLMNAYTVHRSDIALKRTNRTFIRISYDPIIYDRWGNTHNSSFQYKWPMVSRNTLERLVHKRYPIRDLRAV
jgi:hypothetical protein